MNESEKMKKSVLEIGSLGLSAKIELMSSGMNPGRLRRINFLMECNPDIVHSSFSITLYINRDWGATEKEQSKGNIKSVVEHIHKYGKTANISFMDATRANSGKLLELAASGPQKRERRGYAWPIRQGLYRRTGCTR